VSLWIIFFSIVRLLVPYRVLFSVVLANLGYASTSGRPFRLLKRVEWQFSKCSSVKDGIIYPFVVSLERKK
jgi:hypothetical protein